MMFVSLHGKPLGELSMAEIISDLLPYKETCTGSSDFALLLKALLLIEGIGRELDESFNIFEIAEPFARELVAKRLRPDKILKKGLSEGKEYTEMLLQLPTKLDTALDLVNHDRLQINFHHRV